MIAGKIWNEKWLYFSPTEQLEPGSRYFDSQSTAYTCSILKLRLIMKYFSLFLFLFCLPLLAPAQLRISLESGLTFSQYNDVQVPNGDVAAGTRFSLSDDFTPDQAQPFLRLELAYLIKQRHMIELTAAPLILQFQNSTLDSINFAGTTFSGVGIDGRYEFNTYRASYRYRFIQKPKFTLDAGLSLLVRDARIALSQNDLLADDVDLGFVPLISFELQYRPTDKLSIMLKGDALVGPQGRAEDIFGGLLYTLLQDRLQLKAGYRFIEGGADVEQVYNFAFIHFVDLGLVLTL